ncbi:MAG: NUDIX hydrolase [Chloroflexota bacterium]
MAKFCPHCGRATVKKMFDQRERDVCPEGHFVQFARTSIGVGGLIIRDDHVLLVERGIPPIGLWTLVSGYVEEGETLDQAIVREAHEEVGIEVRPRGIIFVRNMQERNTSNVYSVFLCDVDTNVVPQPDGNEATAAEFVPLVDVATDTRNISPYARWFVETYRTQRPQPLTWHPTGFDEPLTRIYTQGQS